MAKIVKVVIDETGGFSVDLTGFQGQGCGDIIKVFSNIGAVTKETHKPEWKASQKINQKAGV